MKIYLAGSLRNDAIPDIANALEAALNADATPAAASYALDTPPRHTVWADWKAAGPKADDEWRDYEKRRGRTYEQAIRGDAAQNVLAFDRHHLDTSDALVLVLPAGLSAGIELGRQHSKGKPCAVLLNDAERWDVMLAFLPCVTSSVDEVARWLLASESRGDMKPKTPIRGPGDPGYRYAMPPPARVLCVMANVRPGDRVLVYRALGGWRVTPAKDDSKFGPDDWHGIVGDEPADAEGFITVRRVDS